MFIFKLIGAPDCLIDFNEFVYDIQRVNSSNQSNSNINILKVNDFGYINYDYSFLKFQEGGSGRGTGEAYINQWKPEFEPILREDNIKVQTGSADLLISNYSTNQVNIASANIFGTQPVVNTKEVNFDLSPARAVECDVFAYYQESGSCQSITSTTVPSYITSSFNCDNVNPPSISAMTLTQYINFLYTTNINPRNRKTYSQNHNTWYYPELRNIYFNYYLNTTPQSNQMTIGSLENYLHLLEVQFRGYILQLIPATTIFKANGTVYKNPIFHRQRFVYKRGLNDGSEFRTFVNTYAPQTLFLTELTTEVNLGIDSNVFINTINPSIDLGITSELSTIVVTGNTMTQIDCELYAYSTSGTMRLMVTSTIASKPYKTKTIGV